MRRLEKDERRFWSKVSQPEGEAGCMKWLGWKTRDGYGQLRIDGRKPYAHRVSYEWLVGPVPDGLELDHLCRNTSCVRPDHLEPVTRSENILRGLLPAVTGIRQRSKTQCPKGHSYSGANLYTRPNGVR